MLVYETLKIILVAFRSSICTLREFDEAVEGLNNLLPNNELAGMAWLDIVYEEGLQAGISSGKFECPYIEDSLAEDVWFDGLGDGTQAFIDNKNSLE